MGGIVEKDMCVVHRDVRGLGEQDFKQIASKNWTENTVSMVDWQRQKRKQKKKKYCEL